MINDFIQNMSLIKSKSTNSIKYLTVLSLLLIKNSIFTILIVNLKYYSKTITQQILKLIIIIILIISI